LANTPSVVARSYCVCPVLCQSHNNSHGTMTEKKLPKSKPESRESCDSVVVAPPRLQRTETGSLVPPMLSRRRSSVHRRSPTLSRYQTTSIDKHYEISNQILAACDSNYNQGCLRTAYALGVQYLETALLEIPKHGYFNSVRHERERMQTALHAVRIGNRLGEIQNNDVPWSTSDRERLEKLQKLALEQVDKASQDQYESQRAATETEIRKQESSAEWVLFEPFLACSESLTSMLRREDHEPRYHSTYSQRPLSGQQPRQFASADWEESASDAHKTPTITTKLLASKAPVPTDDYVFAPIDKVQCCRTDNAYALAKTAPYDTSKSTSERLSRNFVEKLSLEKALFLSGLEVFDESVQGDEARVTPFSGRDTASTSSTCLSATLQLATLSSIYHEDLDQLRRAGLIRISFADTYQGCVPGSTNGCTVIAPLFCIHHLVESQEIPDPGLPDATITHVIDHETPAILRQLRRQLGLSEQAFLIPSDVHDFFIENGQLAQSQFVNVVGGNILDDVHLSAFVDSLEAESVNGRQVAATLFFHEHVVAILKLQRGKGKCWYDFIDSLPLRKTLSRPGEDDIHLDRRLGVNLAQPEISDSCLPMTARIRCLDSSALKVFLRWYACSKFGEENVCYINAYEWDDLQSDFDPRVFQAFVWADTA
jgi:hypothetical protein